MRVGVVGLGIMGQAIAAKLLEAGHEVTVNNRTREKATHLLMQGAKWAETPKALAAQSDVVISIVTDAGAVLDISREENGILAGLSAAGVHVDMSTVAPDCARMMQETYSWHT